MEPTVDIQPISERYAEALRHAVDLVARERLYLASVTGFTAEETLDFIHQIMEGGGVQFVALESESVVGWCDILRNKYEGTSHVGSLGMGVIGPHRQRGIGKALLRVSMDAAADIGISKVELEVFASNEPARKLYETTGFVTEGIKKGARMLDGKTDDIVCMAYFL